MENKEITGITWTELLKPNDDFFTLKQFIIEKMKKHYSHYEKDGVTYFKIDKDTVMYICVLHWQTENSLVMSYCSPDDDDDGDQYYPDDYTSPDEMFESMLKEIRSNINNNSL